MFDIEFPTSELFKEGSLEQLEKILDNEADLSRQVEQQQLGKALALAMNELQQGIDLDRFERCVDIIEELADDLDPEDSKRFVELARKIERIALKAKAAQTFSHLEELSKSASALKYQFEGVEERLERVWSDVVNKYFAPKQKLGALLSKIQSTSQLGVQLEACAAKGLKLKDISPIGNQTRDTFVHTRQECAEIIHELGQVNAFSAFQDLAALMFDGQARLDNITPELFEWLTQNGFASSIKVTL